MNCSGWSLSRQLRAQGGTYPGQDTFCKRATHIPRDGEELLQTRQTVYTPHRQMSWRRSIFSFINIAAMVNKMTLFEGLLALCFLVLLREATKNISWGVDFLAQRKFKQPP